MRPPNYFETVRAKAARRWQQLEADPELAAPWHQLFRQVQSPRHVLSELLQNADDAGAKQARARIEGDEFVFEHDGKDFSPDEFDSLCKFGYSNKRNLHTIGFRGVGFKSVFSLSDEILLSTPTLSVVFHKERFTEPTWVDRGAYTNGTQIRVRLLDSSRRQQLARNLQEWTSSPLSLLFFRSIRELEIDGDTACKQRVGPGPVPGSEWMQMGGDTGTHYLLLTSPTEPFLVEARTEIRQERGGTDDLQLPPCSIQILLGAGAGSKLFVVLPTGASTGLPFACNAPFVQDPARLSLKDPAISPTNYCLLQRAGRYAAQAMIGWLQRDDLELSERSKAYALLCNVGPHGDDVGHSCGRIVEAAFREELSRENFVLTEDGDLVAEGACVGVPRPLFNVWEPEQVREIIDEGRRPLLCRHVSIGHQAILGHYGTIDEVDDHGVLEALMALPAPRPGTWQQLLLLWEFVFRAVMKHGAYAYRRRCQQLAIAPVSGSEALLPAASVIRLGEGRLLGSDDDWAFIAQHAFVLDANWLGFLSAGLKRAEEHGNDSLATRVENAYRLLTEMSLGEASNASRVMERVTAHFFRQGSRPKADYVRLAQIAAALSAEVPPDFAYVTGTGELRRAADTVVADLDGQLGSFVSREWYRRHVLDSAYQTELISCSRQQWYDWVSSGRGGIHPFIPLERTDEYLSGRETIGRVMTQRGPVTPVRFPYKPNNFVIEDWDYAEEHWQHWRVCASADDKFWCCLLAAIMGLPPRQWLPGMEAVVKQIATTGTRRAVADDGLVARWLLKLRGLPCLEDGHGGSHEPASLLRRTPMTEALLDVEPFVKAEYDTETVRPLFVALGVRDTPTGPERLLERLRALSQSDAPPVNEILKWYRRLDSVTARCSMAEMAEVRSVFQNEKLILTESGAWARAEEVFLRADEAVVSESATVHTIARDLPLWERVGVAQRPTAELVLAWLRGIESGSNISGEEDRRVRTALALHAEQVWNEAGHWLNLNGEWTPATQLAYKLAATVAGRSAHLFPAVRSQTADLRMVAEEVRQSQVFADLRALSSAVEERLVTPPNGHGVPEHKRWLATLGQGLTMAVFEDEERTRRVRDVGLRLLGTLWLPVTDLQLTAYIDGIPAGTARTAVAHWEEPTLYVEDLPVARTCKAVTAELCRHFDDTDVTEAVKVCFEREPAFIMEYLEENFQLEPVDMPAAVQPAAGANTVETSTVDDQLGRAPDEPASPGEATAGWQEEPPMAGDGGRMPASQSDGVEVGMERRSGAPAQPRLIERYAQAAGYRADQRTAEFVHPSGSRLRQTSDSPFRWQKWSPDGEVVQSYWVKDHCLDGGPMEIAAEVMDLCILQPEEYSLIVAAQDGHPLVLSGRVLARLRGEGRIRVYPAAYRIVLEDPDSWPPSD